MQLTPISNKYDLGYDLLLADGSVVFKDGRSRWVRVAVDGTERVLSQPKVAIADCQRGCNCDACTALIESAEAVK
jgi:hypothetical protein